MDNLDQLETLSENTTTTQFDHTTQVTAPELQAMDNLVRSNQSPKVPPVAGKPFKIGICGGHSSGKALLTEKLLGELTAQGFKACVVKQDNFDVDSDDFEHYKLNSNKQNSIPYVNNQYYQKFLVTAINALDSITDVNVIIIEGTLILYDKQLRDKLDLKIFLRHDQDVRLSRKGYINLMLVFKEVCTKGKDIEKVIYNYLNRLKPLFESIIKPTEQYADIIIPKFGGEFSLKQTDRNFAAQAGFDKVNPDILSLLVKIAKANILVSQGSEKQADKSPIKQ